MKRTKTLIVMMMCVMMVMMSLTQISVFADDEIEGNIKIYIDGRELYIPENMGSPFINSDARTMVPVRAVTEGLGKKVEWDGATQTVTLDESLSLVIGSNILTTPQGPTKMDTKAILRDGRTYLPLRFISEGFGYEVGYEFSRGYHNISINRGTEVVVDENFDGTVIDISKYKDVPVYPKDGLNSVGVGFMETPQIGTRPSGSSYEDDLETLNELLDNSGYKLNEGGYLTYSASSTGMAGNSAFWVKRTDDNKPVISIRNWSPDKEEDGVFQRVNYIMNMTAETLSYYSKSREDAKAIWKTIDNLAKNSSNEVDYSKPLKYGNTVIKFLNPDSYGIDIVIENSN
ncbi:stalk domain-containing protein [Dethiothermospora halolimnae]|uniref:stalk domain-containing protein n=1 Tax=Dethiothermospora halolimnae TaxID=3114390 RepID=UPI003CCB8B02